MEKNQTLTCADKLRHRRRDQILTVGALIVLFALLFAANSGETLSSYSLRILRLVGVYTIAALSMNLINGLTGQFSLGQAGFMAIGAYSTSLFLLSREAKETLYYVVPAAEWVKNLSAPFGVALIIGGLIAAMAAFLIGFPVLRLRSDYLAIATLGFSEIIRIIITNTTSITNGSMGIKGIPDTANIWWTTIVMGLCIALMLRIMNTSYGRAFKAIRDDEVAAQAMGIHLFRHKMISFVLSGFLAGISGGLLASVVGVLTPTYFRFTLAYEILLIVVLGGQGSITGSLIGAAVVTVAKEWLRFMDDGFAVGSFTFPAISGMRMLTFSVFLMIIILFFRQGLFGSNEFSWEGLLTLPGRIKANAASRKKAPNEHPSGGEPR